jgi:hypothetical protein
MSIQVEPAIITEGFGNSKLSVRQSIIEIRSGMAFIRTRFYNLPPNSSVVRRSDLAFNEAFCQPLSDEECERLTRESQEQMEEAFREKFG